MTVEVMTTPAKTARLGQPRSGGRIMNIALQEKQSVRSVVSEAEWATRVELAAFYRAVDMLGLTEQMYNHISARVPDADDQLLLNPFGLDYSEITASSLVKVDF